MRLPYTFAVARFGGRNWTIVSTAAAARPLPDRGLRPAPGGVVHARCSLCAAVAGVGGGNFSSSMANIDAFYPQRLKGWALGLNAGGGNLGVAAVQLVGLAVLATAGRRAPPADPRRLPAADRGGRGLRRRCTWTTSASATNDKGAMREVVRDRARLDDRRSSTSAPSARSSASASPSARCCRCSSASTCSARRPRGRLPHVPRPAARLADPPGRRPAGRPARRRPGDRSAPSWRMAVGAAVVLVASTHDSLPLFLVGFVALFVLSGLGNGSTYKMIPAIFRAKADPARRRRGRRTGAAERPARRLSRALIGIAGAIGGLGGVLVNLAFRQSFLSSGTGDGAYVAFIGFYVACVVVTWAVYLRPSAAAARRGLSARPGPPTGPTVTAVPSPSGPGRPARAPPGTRRRSRSRRTPRRSRRCCRSRPASSTASGSTWTPASAATPARWPAPSRTACRRARCGAGSARSRAATTPTPGGSTCRCRATTASTRPASRAAPPTPTRSWPTASSPTTPTTASAASTAPGTARTRCRCSSPTGASSPSATCASPASTQGWRRPASAPARPTPSPSRRSTSPPGGPTTRAGDAPRLPAGRPHVSTTRIELPDGRARRETVRGQRLEPPPRAPPLAAGVADAAQPGGGGRQRHGVEHRAERVAGRRAGRGRAGRARCSTSAGRPRAWKALRNLRRSWLSREVLLLGAYAVLAAGRGGRAGGSPCPAAVGRAPPGVYASARLYVVPGPPGVGHARSPSSASAPPPSPLGPLAHRPRRRWPRPARWSALAATAANWVRLAPRAERAVAGQRCGSSCAGSGRWTVAPAGCSAVVGVLAWPLAGCAGARPSWLLAVAGRAHRPLAVLRHRRAAQHAGVVLARHAPGATDDRRAAGPRRSAHARPLAARRSLGVDHGGDRYTYVDDPAAGR